MARAKTWLPALMMVLALAIPQLSALDPHGQESLADGEAVLQMSYALADWHRSDATAPAAQDAAQDALREMWRWGWPFDFAQGLGSGGWFRRREKAAGVLLRSSTPANRTCVLPTGSAKRSMRA